MTRSHTQPTGPSEENRCQGPQHELPPAAVATVGCVSVETKVVHLHRCHSLFWSLLWRRRLVLPFDLCLSPLIYEHLFEFIARCFDAFTALHPPQKCDCWHLCHVTGTNTLPVVCPEQLLHFVQLGLDQESVMHSHVLSCWIMTDSCEDQTLVLGSFYTSPCY